MPSILQRNWTGAFVWLKTQREIPEVRFLLSVATQKIRGKVRPTPRFPPAKGLVDQRKKLREELEDLCKRIVKARDLDEMGWGNCVTCGHRSNHLQWGHFVARSRSPWLYYDPRNTAMQCGACNAPHIGQGRGAEFAVHLDRKFYPGYASELVAEAHHYDRALKWRPNVDGLKDKKAELLGWSDENYDIRSAV